MARRPGATGRQAGVPAPRAAGTRDDRFATPAHRSPSSTDLDMDPVALSEVLDAFGRNRLLSFDRDTVTGDATVEVAHEALLREWERLAGWIDRHRAALRRHETFTTAAEEWEAAGREPDYLVAGSRLTEFEAAIREGTLQLTGRERAFLEASTDRRRDERADRRPLGSESGRSWSAERGRGSSPSGSPCSRSWSSAPMPCSPPPAQAGARRTAIQRRQACSLPTMIVQRGSTAPCRTRAHTAQDGVSDRPPADAALRKLSRTAPGSSSSRTWRQTLTPSPLTSLARGTSWSTCRPCGRT